LLWTASVCRAILQGKKSRQRIPALVLVE
jgi:hypothetical protein